MKSVFPFLSVFRLLILLVGDYDCLVIGSFSFLADVLIKVEKSFPGIVLTSFSGDISRKRIVEKCLTSDR